MLIEHKQFGLSPLILTFWFGCQLKTGGNTADGQNKSDLAQLQITGVQELNWLNNKVSTGECHQKQLLPITAPEDGSKIGPFS